MQLADDSTKDYKALVQHGYDQCAAAYAGARQEEAHPELAWLIARLPEGACVLDIGCGAGLPIARALAERQRVTGVDLSGEQVRLARANVPRGAFIHADVMAVDFPAHDFDAVVMFYTLFHLPREEHQELLRRVHRWLKPGGYLMMTVTRYAEAPYTEEDFFGVKMYWSNYGFDDYKRMLMGLGFRLLDTTVIGHGYGQDAPAEDHPLIFAQVEK